MNSQSIEDYFRSQFERVVARDHRELVIARGNERRIEKPSSLLTAATRTDEDQARSSQIIEEVRRLFWDSPADEIDSKLRQIDTQAYPEYADAIQRLQAGNQAREEFVEIGKKLKPNDRLLELVKQYIVATSVNAAGIKEVVSRELRWWKYFFQYRTVAKLIKDGYPQIYAMDPSWFREILRAKLRHLFQSTRTQLIIFVVVILLFRMLVYILEGE